ncbi:hypothetical protein EGW08_007373, partial [Elysia chlorotica]
MLLFVTNLRVYFGLFIILYCLTQGVTCEQTLDFFTQVGETKELTFNYTLKFQTPSQSGGTNSSSIYVSLTDYYIAELLSPKEYVLPSGSSTGRLKVKVKGLLPGRAYIEFKYSPDIQNSSLLPQYGLQISRTETIADIAFNVLIVLVVAITNVGLGCEVDLDVVRNQLKSPMAIAIGL